MKRQLFVVALACIGLCPQINTMQRASSEPDLRSLATAPRITGDTNPTSPSAVLVLDQTVPAAVLAARAGHTTPSGDAAGPGAGRPRIRRTKTNFVAQGITVAGEAVVGGARRLTDVTQQATQATLATTTATVQAGRDVRNAAQAFDAATGGTAGELSKLAARKVTEEIKKRKYRKAVKKCCWNVFCCGCCRRKKTKPLYKKVGLALGRAVFKAAEQYGHED